MTQRDILKFGLLNTVDSYLKQHNFVLNKQSCMFTKKTKLGWNKFQLIFLFRDKGWEIEPAMLIRVHTVENVFHQTSGFDKKSQSGTPTIGSPIQYYINAGEKSTYDLNEVKDIDLISEEIIKAYKNIAVPFFERYADIEVINNDINDDINDTHLTGSIFKGSKGIILAKLTNDIRYNDLKKLYHHQYEVFCKGFYLPEYLNLLDYLDKK